MRTSMRFRDLSTDQLVDLIKNGLRDCAPETRVRHVTALRALLADYPAGYRLDGPA